MVWFWGVPSCLLKSSLDVGPAEGNLLDSCRFWEDGLGLGQQKKIQSYKVPIKLAWFSILILPYKFQRNVVFFHTMNDHRSVNPGTQIIFFRLWRFEGCNPPSSQLYSAEKPNPKNPEKTSVIPDGFRSQQGSWAQLRHSFWPPAPRIPYMRCHRNRLHPALWIRIAWKKVEKSLQMAGSYRWVMLSINVYQQVFPKREHKYAFTYHVKKMLDNQFQTGAKQT